MGCRTLTCSSLIPLPNGYVKVYPTISSLQHARLLKQALKPDTKMICRRYSKLESRNQTCLPVGLQIHVKRTLFRQKHQVYFSSKFCLEALHNGPFVQSPYNFSGPKSNIQIEIKGIRGVRVLASKILHFFSLTDSFIMLDAKLLKFLACM